MVRFDCFSLQVFCSEMIEDPVKVVNELLKDKIRVNFIINHRAGEGSPDFREDRRRLHMEKQQGLF